MKRTTTTSRRRISSSQRKKSFRKSRSRIPQTAVIAIILFTLYSIAGFIAVPYYCTKILPKKILAATGLYLHSAGIHFNPYTFSLIAEGLSIEDTGEKPIIFIDKVNTRLALLPLLRAEWVCTELMLRRVQLNIVRIEKNRYNISKLLPKFRRNGADNMMNFSELPFYFSLNNIDIQQADILFNDKLTATSHHITDISVRIPTISNFSYEIEHYVSPYFSATINGTAMEMIGKKNGNPQVLTATFSDLSLERYQPYLPVELPVTLEGGRLDGTIDIDFINFRKSTTSNRAKELSLAFDIAIKTLGVRGKRSPENALFKEIALKGKYQAINNTLTLDKAHFISPQFNGKLPAKKNILVYFLKPKHAGPQSNTAAPDNVVPTTGNTFSFLLKNLLVSKGKVLLTAAKEREIWQNITLQAENIRADTRRITPVDGKEKVSSGAVRMRAEYATDKNRPASEKKTILSLQADISPYHGKGAPRFANMTVEIENLHNPATIFRSLGLDIANDETFSLAAKKARLGPIDTHVTPFSLGKLAIVGGKVHTMQDKPPLFLQLLLKTTPPFFHLAAFSYQGTLTVNSAHDPEKSLFISDLSFTGSGRWGETMKTDFSAFLSPKKEEPPGSLAPPQIQGEGTLFFTPPSLQTRITLQNIALGKELPSPLVAAADRPFSGTLSGTGSLIIPAGSFSGNFTISAGKTENTPGATTWEQLHAKGVDIKNIFNKDSKRTLQKMEIKNLHTSLLFTDREPPLASATRTLNMFRQKNGTIDSLHIFGSKINIEDRRITPFWKAAISNVSATVTPLQTSAAIESEVQFFGNLDGGTLEARGSMQLNKPLYDTRLFFTGADIPNALFGEQLPAETLLQASAGTTDFSLNSLWINDKMSSRGEALFSGIEAAPDKSNIATALAIAGGTQRKFALEMKLSAEPGERTIPLYYTLYQQLHRRLLKAEVSPLLLADEEFHSLAKEQEIMFLQGKSELTGSGEKNLQNYFRFVKRYPATGLTLTLKKKSDEDKEAATLLSGRLKYLATRCEKELLAADAARISLTTSSAEKQAPAAVQVDIHPAGLDKTPDHKQREE